VVILFGHRLCHGSQPKVLNLFIPNSGYFKHNTVSMVKECTKCNIIPPKNYLSPCMDEAKIAFYKPLVWLLKMYQYREELLDGWPLNRVLCFWHNKDGATFWRRQSRLGSLDPGSLALCWLLPKMLTLHISGFVIAWFIIIL